LPLHVHLVAQRPERYVNDFARLGCAGLTVPVEACTHAHRTFGQIREAGMNAGASLSPGTALTKLEYVLPLLDRIVLPTDDGGPADRDPPGVSFERTRILRENLDYRESGATLLVEGDLRPHDAARMIAGGAHGVVIDRLDVLRIEPLDASLRAYVDAVTAAIKTA
jgi:ribulose-phosphate 3-epimerase